MSSLNISDLDNVTVPFFLPVNVIKMENFVDVQFCLECLGIFLYLYMVYVLVTSKNQIFRHAFYELFSIGAIFDISLMIAIIYMRLRKRINLCEDSEFWTRIANALTATNFIVHVYINMLIALNRFTALALPIKHERIWSRRNYRILCLLLIIFSFASQGNLFFETVNFIITQGSCAFGKKGSEFARILSVVSVGIFEMDCLLLSPITIYYMYQMRKKYGQMSKRKRQETNLAFFTLIKCICFSCELIYELVNLFKIPVMDNFFIEFINNEFWAYFYILIFLNCPTLLLLSGLLRKEIINRWKKAQSAVNSINTPTIFVKPNK